MRLGLQHASLNDAAHSDHKQSRAPTQCRTALSKGQLTSASLRRRSFPLRALASESPPPESLRPAACASTSSTVMFLLGPAEAGGVPLPALPGVCCLLVVRANDAGVPACQPGITLGLQALAPVHSYVYSYTRTTSSSKRAVTACKVHLEMQAHHLHGRHACRGVSVPCQPSRWWHLRPPLPHCRPLQQPEGRSWMKAPQNLLPSLQH